MKLVIHTENSIIESPNFPEDDENKQTLNKLLKILCDSHQLRGKGLFYFSINDWVAAVRKESIEVIEIKMISTS